MKKSTKTAALLILALLCILPLLAACRTSTTGNEPIQPSEPEKQEPLTVFSDGVCNYTIVRPEKCSNGVSKGATSLKNALQTAIGSKSVKIKEDYLYDGQTPEEFEILIGPTNREESAEVLNTLRYQDFAVVIEGKKLVIAAHSDEKITEAVNYVIELINNAQGTLIINTEDQKTVRAEYTVDSVSIGNTDLTGYCLVTPKETSALAEAAVSAFQEKVLEASGIYLPIKKDSEEETEKEILVGDTSRAASASVDSAALGSYGYSISTSGSKIIIKAGLNDTLKKVLENMASQIPAGKINEASSSVEAPILTTFMFTDVHNAFAMLEPTNNTGDYVVRKNVDLAIDHLLEDCGPVDVVLVGGDLISDYPSWNNSGNWPYKYFTEYRELLVKTFKRLSKDGKVSYVAGNHDYAQGELATDGPGKNGSYNSLDFYFGDVGMRQDWGELPEEDCFIKVGEKTGEKYLLAYYYEVNGIGFVGLSSDHDKIWATQGSGFDDECLKWLDNKLDEVDPDGNKIIIVNCHYFGDLRKSINEDGTNTYERVDYDKAALTKIFLGHKNLYHIFGHGEVWFSDTTSRYVSHYDSAGTLIDVTGKETDSTELVSYENRGFTSIYGGTFRPHAGSYPHLLGKDQLTGYGGYPQYGHSHLSTATPRAGQGLYIEVFEDRIVFTMKNFGDFPGFKTTDLITPYTVWLSK